jgi:transposase
MPFAPAPRLRLRKGDRERLEVVVRKRTASQRDVHRARIILLCADGRPHRQVKRELRTTIDTIVLWRGRYEREGLEGLKDRPRPGRPPTFSPGRAT